MKASIERSVGRGGGGGWGEREGVMVEGLKACIQVQYKKVHYRIEICT